MRIELTPERFDEGVGDFDIGHVLCDTEGNPEITITKFTGYSEIDEADGTEHEEIVVGFNDGSTISFQDLERAVYRDSVYTPISPDWFVEEVRGEVEGREEAEAERKTASETEASELLIVREVKAKTLSRPVEYLTDQELMAKISGAPLAIAEDMLITYEGNLARLAGSTPKQMQKISGIGKVRSGKIVAAFELGKRLARFHAKKDKITKPADVADLMMSKMRYLSKEIVCVLALDTKGSVTSTGTAGDLANDLKWGKMIAESTVFEGTLNASVFHPREIFRFAIEETANSVVLVHNHPSGDPQPSQEDIRATKQLIEAGNQIGIKVLDHIIIGDGIFVSLKEENFI